MSATTAPVAETHEGRGLDAPEPKLYDVADHFHITEPHCRLKAAYMVGLAMGRRLQGVVLTVPEGGGAAMSGRPR